MTRRAPPRPALDVLDTRIGRRLVSLFLLAGMLPLGLFALPLYWETNRGLEEEARHQMLGTARLASVQVARTLELARSRIEMEAARGEAPRIVDPFRRIDVRRDAVAGEVAMTTPYAAGRGTTVAFLAPRRGGGVLVGEVDPGQLWEATRGRNFGPGDLLLVLNGRGEILAASADPEGEGSVAALFPQRLPAADEASGEGDWGRWGPVLWAFSEVESRDIANDRWAVVLARRVDSASASGTRLFRSLLLFLALSLSLLILLAFHEARELHAPLADLLQATRSLAEGDWTVRAASARGDELGTLARSFNEMTETLQRNNQALIRLEGEALVGRLASTVAHEVNNPLAAIKNRLGLLRTQITPAERPGLDALDEQINRISRTVRTLLDFSTQQARRDEPVSLLRLLTSVADLFHPSFRSKGVRFEVHLPPSLPTISGDAGAIQQILVNLLENARESLASGKSVRLSASAREGEVEIVVVDDGPGLGENPEHLFQPFHTTRPEGTGLGLAIARRLAEAHGGSLRGENRDPAEGGGARFTIRLPTRFSGDERPDLVILQGGKGE